MKNCKKLGVLLLALTVVATSGIMSFADGNAGSNAADSTGEQNVEQTENQDAKEHPHNLVICKTCRGKKTVKETQVCQACEGPAPTVECTDCEGAGTREKLVPDQNTPCPNKGFACDGCKDCRFGEALVMKTVKCSTCGGAGRIPDPASGLCETCKGKGTFIAEVACSTCSGTGKVRCTKEFAKGVLYSINKDGSGVVRHTCSTCKAYYETTMAAANVPAALAASVKITGPEASVSGTRVGEKVKFTVSINNKGYVIVPGAELTLTLADGWELYGDNPVSTNHKDDTFQVNGSEITVTLKELRTYSSYDITVCAALTDETAAVGTFYDALTLETVMMNDTAKTPLNLPENCVAKVRLNKYKGRKVALAGPRMARGHGDSGILPNSLALTKLLGELDDIDGKVFRFENFNATYIAPDYGETVINSATQKVWQCIGFIPANFNYSAPDFVNLEKQVFSSIEGNKFTRKTMDEVKQYINEKNGVLYGVAVTEEQLNEWQNMEGGNHTIYLMPVWLVKEWPIESEAYGDLSITHVELPEEAMTSNGIKVECTQAEGWNKDGHEYYEADILVTIGKEALSAAHVNLNEALAAAAAEFNAGANVEPGDTLYYTLTIKDESGKKYTYVDNSGIIATKNMYSSGNIAGIGFDSFKLAEYSKSEKSAYARRINNAPLMDLDVKRISDESIGEKLRGLGYGANDESLSNEEITKKYLANYYLDWINSVRVAQGKEKAKGFEDLTIGEFSVLTNGDNGEAVPETCRPVVEALYYFYYGKALTFKFNDKTEMSLYDQMVNCQNGKSDLEEVIPALLKGETDADKYMLKVSVAGEEVNNAFQNTKFGFRLEFDLKASEPEPEPTPDPDPTPTPTPTPDPTPEPEPTPDPQPLPPDDPLIPDEPTVDPQPLPSDDPLIEGEDPKQPLPEDEHLEDPDQPKTGDQSDLALWLGVMVLAGGTVVTMRVRRKKED